VGREKKYQEDELRPHRMNWAWLILCALAWSSAASAQEWPVRPVRVIVPVSAGSAIDLVSRAVFDQLSLQLGQPLVIEYRLGAGGAVGAASVAKAEPDGYTVLAHSAAIAVSVHTVLNAGYDAVRDFADQIQERRRPRRRRQSAPRLAQLCLGRLRRDRPSRRRAVPARRRHRGAAHPVQGLAGGAH
jgi:hypothetical protein